eukprot:UN12300
MGDKNQFKLANNVRRQKIKDRKKQFEVDMKRIRIEEEEKMNNDIARYKTEHSADLILAKKENI